MDKAFEDILRQPALSREDIKVLLAAEGERKEQLLRRGLEVKLTHLDNYVHLRGLIEFGNACEKNCLYCGIRKGNGAVRRYRMPADEIVRAAEWSCRAGYGSVVLQSGEVGGEANAAFVEGVLRRIREACGPEFGITISLGEQEEDVYRRWKEAGAHRYLLRIETSNPELYARLHPADHSWERRRECLRALRRCGYQVGSGVMCGLPGQSAEDLAADIEFFWEEDLDMIGMGPYIPHAGTPLGAEALASWSPEAAARRLELGLGMIAATRLYLHDVNIAAATALQALDPEGREKGLLAGANVVMPNFTPVARRDSYALYDGKSRPGAEAAETLQQLKSELDTIGYHV